MLAGGSGSRIGAGLNKVYLPVAGHPVVWWSLASAARVAHVVSAVLVVRPEDIPLAEDVLRPDAGGLDVRITVGGATRHASEDAALALLAPDVERGSVDVIAVHDGARPLAGPALWRSVIEIAHAVGGAVPALPAPGVLPAATLTDGIPAGEPATHRLARVQTPQAFRAKDLLVAYAAAHGNGYQGTDTASSVEEFSGLVVRTVPGSPLNLKVTYPRDLAVAERLLTARGDHLA